MVLWLQLLRQSSKRVYLSILQWHLCNPFVPLLIHLRLFSSHLFPDLVLELLDNLEF